MKALSIWQPRASLIVMGKKQCETRSWPIQHRGKILIHASKKFSEGQKFFYEIDDLEPFAKDLKGLDPAKTLGCLIGMVDVIDCIATIRTRFKMRGNPELNKDKELLISINELQYGDYTPNRFAFVLENPVQFPEPIPCRGFQGMFNVPDERLREAGIQF